MSLRALLTAGGLLGYMWLVPGLNLGADGSQGEQSTSPGFWTTIQKSAAAIAAVVTPAVVAIAGVGAATMAVAQAAKDLFHVRRAYNRRRVQKWLEECAKSRPGGELAVKSLEMLATGGMPDALYSLEIEKLALQLTVAARMALDNPEDHQELIACLTHTASQADVALASSPMPKDAAGRAAHLEAKNRVLTSVQRAIDGFHIMLDYRWTVGNQWAVFGINIVVFFFLWIVWSPSRLAVAGAICAAVLSGFVAPVAKDLVTALQGLKGGKF